MEHILGVGDNAVGGQQPPRHPGGQPGRVDRLEEGGLADLSEREVPSGGGQEQPSDGPSGSGQRRHQLRLGLPPAGLAGRFDRGGTAVRAQVGIGGDQASQRRGILPPRPARQLTLVGAVVPVAGQEQRLGQLTLGQSPEILEDAHFLGGAETRSSAWSVSPAPTASLVTCS